MRGRVDGKAVPVRGVDDDGPSRRLRAGPEGLGQGPDEFPQGRFHFGGGGARAGDEEQGPGLRGVEAAQVGARPSDQRPAASPPGLGVHRDPRHGEGFEVPARRAGRHLELERHFGHRGPAPGLQEEEGGDEAIGSHGPSIAPKLVTSWP